MAIGTFFHAEPNNGPNKSQVTGAGPNNITDSQYPSCGISTQYGNAQILACSGYSGNLLINGNFTAQGTTHTLASVTIASNSVTATTFNGNLNGVASGNKVLPFDIPHVTQKGKRIRHIIAEGPEPGIYVRGKIKDTNVIELPDYWDGLVDPESITVTLTQIGYSQDLIVKGVENNVVNIVSGNAANIHCYYEVWAARWLNPMNHEEKLHVVYEGETPDDYPGGNQNFLIGGWDYDRRNPQWGTPE